MLRCASRAVLAGDIVLFSMSLLHGSLTNQTRDTMRLSCDIRFQPVADPVDDRYTLNQGVVGAKNLDRGNFKLAKTRDRRTMAQARNEWGIAPADAKGSEVESLVRSGSHRL